MLLLLVVLSGCLTESSEGACTLENFYFDDQAIHFIYNQYEIACYADGIIEAIVAW